MTWFVDMVLLLYWGHLTLVQQNKHKSKSLKSHTATECIIYLKSCIHITMLIMMCYLMKIMVLLPLLRSLDTRITEQTRAFTLVHVPDAGELYNALLTLMWCMMGKYGLVTSIEVT